MKVAVVSDDLYYKRRIKYYFEQKNLNIEIFKTNDEILFKENIYDFDILVLDIDSSYEDRFEVLEYFEKKLFNIPSLVISNKRDIFYIKKAFKMGTYDYIKKPFEIEELNLRIENILRCIKYQKEIQISDSMKYNLSKRELLYKNSKIYLTKKQDKILYFLLKNRGKIVPPDILGEFVWNEEIKSFKTISSHIRDIHKKIGKKIIKNIKGIGYIIE